MSRKTQHTRFEDKILRSLANEDKPQVVTPWVMVRLMVMVLMMLMVMLLMMLMVMVKMKLTCQHRVFPLWLLQAPQIQLKGFLAIETHF